MANLMTLEGLSEGDCGCNGSGSDSRARGSAQSPVNIIQNFGTQSSTTKMDASGRYYQDQSGRFYNAQGQPVSNVPAMPQPAETPQPAQTPATFDTPVQTFPIPSQTPNHVLPADQLVPLQHAVAKPFPVYAEWI